MKIYLYSKGKKILKNSGIAKAIEHQEKMLIEANQEITKSYATNITIAHINTIFISSLNEIIKLRKNNTKIIYFAHSTKEDFQNSFVMSNLLAPLFKLWLIFCYKHGDIIITPTEYSKKLLQTYNLNKKIYSLTNAIDTTFFSKTQERANRFKKEYSINDNEKVIISVGHFIERKGILDFIQLARLMPNIKFIWFGYTQKYLLTRKIKQAIKNAPKNLIFPGYVNSEKLRDAYCGADLFAFMTKEETEGIVLLEALACKIPTIIYDINVYKDWLETNKDIYKAIDFNDFYQLTKKIIDNKLPDLTENGLLISKQRSISNTSKKLIKIYQEL